VDKTTYLCVSGVIEHLIWSWKSSFSVGVWNCRGSSVDWKWWCTCVCFWSSGCPNRHCKWNNATGQHEISVIEGVLSFVYCNLYGIMTTLNTSNCMVCDRRKFIFGLLWFLKQVMISNMNWKSCSIACNNTNLNIFTRFWWGSFERSISGLIGCKHFSDVM